MKAIHGAFFIEGQGPDPWTEEDARRLAGEFVHPSGKLLAPHVSTPGGLFFVGRVQLAEGGWLPGALCPNCGAAKLHPHPHAGLWKFFCFGCGVPS